VLIPVEWIFTSTGSRMILGAGNHHLHLDHRHLPQEDTMENEANTKEAGGLEADLVVATPLDLPSSKLLSDSTK